MSIRTTRTTISFSEPFEIRNLAGIQPAGEYAVVAEDERIEGLSREAYRRVATLLCLPSLASPQTVVQLVPVTQTDLDVAVMKDRHQTL